MSAMRLAASLVVLGCAAARLSAQTALFTCDQVAWTNAAGAPTTTEDFSSFNVDSSFHAYWVTLAMGRISDNGAANYGLNYVSTPPYVSPPPPAQPLTSNGTRRAECRVDATNGLEVTLELDRRATAFGGLFGDAYLAGGEELSLALYDGALPVASGAIYPNSNCPIVIAPNLTFFGVVSAVPFDRVVFRAQNNLPGLVGQKFTLDDLAVVDAVCWMATSTYCTVGTSQHGCAASIGSSGLPSASAGSGFTLSIGGADGQRNGFLFYGVNGAPLSPLPWGAGSTSYQCALAPTQRLAPASTGGNLGQCDGGFAFDWNAFVAAHPTALGVPFAGGEEVWAQAWIRDPGAVKNACLSDALHFQVCP
jgi:hypothetical protein